MVQVQAPSHPIGGYGHGQKAAAQPF